MLSKLASSSPPTKKVRLTVRAPQPGRSIRIFEEDEQGELTEIEDCSPFNSQANNSTTTTRFPWKSTSVVVPPPPPEEVWVPPTKSTMPEFIFNHVKEYLANTNGWDGEDRYMKTSGAMKILLHSGDTLQVTKEGRKVCEKTRKNRENNPSTKNSNVEQTEIIDVKFASGRITWGERNRSGMCQFDNCWKIKGSEWKCDEHNNAMNATHFLIKDEDNTTATYFLLSSQPHSPKFTHNLDGCLQTARNSKTKWQALLNYENNEKIGKRAARAEDGYDDVDDDEKQRQEEELNPSWKLVTKRSWIAQDLESSKIFKQTANIILAIIATLNVNATNQLQIIGDQFYIDKVDWTVVKTILESCGFRIALGEPSEYGTLVESPLLKKEDLKWRDGDEWIYMKYGTIGRIYVGTIKQQTASGLGPMPKSYIHWHHDPSDKGIPIFQCEAGDDEFIKKETAKMESVGQLGVILCKMLGGTIDEHPIQIDFDKYEHFSEWETHHLEKMKQLVGFWTSRELEFTPPVTLDISTINWDPVNKYLLAK